jgi:hypothetical protein
MIPIAYQPPPQAPTHTIVVQQPAPVAQMLSPRRGYKPPEFVNRKHRRAYQAACLRRIRHTLFTKLQKRAATELTGVRNVRAELGYLFR